MCVLYICVVLVGSAPGRKKNVPARKLKTNKNNLYNTFGLIVPALKTDRTECVFVLSYSMHKNQTFDSDKDVMHKR